MRKGIDISQWQGDINFDLVKSKIDFVVIRCGYGSTIDPKFLRNVNGFRNARVDISGVYHFMYAIDAEEAKKNARKAIEFCQMAGLPKSTIIWCDLEYDTIDKAKAKGVYLGKNEINLFTNSFCDEILKAGYKTGVYTNKDFINRFYSESTLKKYPVWYAIYDGKQTTDYPCFMKQWSSQGLFPGIAGNVDCNVEFGTVAKEETTTTTTLRYRNKIVHQAYLWLGYNESDSSHCEIIDLYNTQDPLPVGYKVKYDDAWCATFVSACAIAVGYTDIIPTECSCPRMIALFQKLGCWVEDDAYVPSPGDIIFYDWEDTGIGDNTGVSDHVGIVEEVGKDTICVIEGNAGNGEVMRRYLKINGRYIRGFGVPKYTDDMTNEPVKEEPAKLKSIEDVAREVIDGLWGNGSDRINALTNAGYDPQIVQLKVNDILGYNVVHQIALEVIDGKWGNGPIRKIKLTAAGYNYNEIQAEVNRILMG